jgi:hypothetical protein
VHYIVREPVELLPAFYFLDGVIWVGCTLPGVDAYVCSKFSDWCHGHFTAKKIS